MKDRDAELREEIQTHLQMAIADRVARGETPQAAAAAARRELGNVTQVREATRDVWRRRWLEESAQDVRYALRGFRRNPGFALVAILSLALGIGANTALFEVVNAVRLRTLPVADPSSLVEIHIADRDGARGNFQTWFSSVTQPIWREIATNREPFSGLFAWGRDELSLSDGGEVAYGGDALGRRRVLRHPRPHADGRPAAVDGRRRPGLCPTRRPRARHVASGLRRRSRRRSAARSP